MISVHTVSCCGHPVWRRSFSKEGPLRDLVLPRPGPWPKNNTCRGPWALHAYQVSSKSIKRFWRRSCKCKSLTTDGQTDGRTTHDHNRALEPSAPVPLKKQEAQRATYRAPEYNVPPFWGIGQGGHFCLLIGPKNTNSEEDVEILLPVKFHWIPFSGFRGEVENVSANQRPGRPSFFTDRPEKHNLGRGCWDLASY